MIGVPVDGSVAVIGTRWGSETTPGWAYNLDHDPQAWIERDGTRTSVTARRVPEGTEYETIFSDADRIYLGFPRYRGRITKRQVPVFVLEPPVVDSGSWRHWARSADLGSARRRSG